MICAERKKEKKQTSCLSIEGPHKASKTKKKIKQGEIKLQTHSQIRNYRLQSNNLVSSLDKRIPSTYVTWANLW